MGKTQLWPCEYDKKFYDVRLKSSNFVIVIPHCWPNAGTFHAPDGEVIESDRIYSIEESEKQ